MKIIFSRKGIDDAYGKGASPIFPNAEMLSIPIPVRAREKGILYKDIKFRQQHIQTLIRQLELPIKRRVCHLDPDLNPLSVKRHADWKPCLGHHGAAAKHLLNNHISKGDIILFFGSFRQVDIGKYRKWKFKPDSKKQHVLFGFLRISQIFDLKNRLDRQLAIQRGYENHPHLLNDYASTNLLFIADEEKASSGLFRFHQDLVLSQQHASKSIWELPSFFNDLKISRHDNRDRFSLQDDKTILKTVGIGQDFVVEENEQVTKWANQLMISHSFDPQ